MTPPEPFYHALLRPAVLQILRAAGYHSARPAVVDSLTDLAARYLAVLCAETARHAADNDTSLCPTVVDARLALEDAGALMPQRNFEEQEFFGAEDTRGVEDFVAWFTGPRHKEIRRVALEAGVEEEATDYLTGEF
jgi:transcription initiation factor TFIID subunit 3